VGEKKSPTIRVIERTLSGDCAVIYPVGDIHIGDPAARLDLFQRLVEKIQNQENAYLLLLGDIINNAIKTSVSNVYNEVIPPSEQKKLAVELLRPVAQKILCMVSGNHEYRTKKEVDQDVSLDIALALGIEDRYDPFHILCDVQVKKARFVLYIFHGHSATRLPGGTVNAYQYTQLNIFGVDAFIHGHSHYPYAMPYSTFFYAPNNRKVQEKIFYDISVAPWTSWADYATRKQLRPRPITPIRITLHNPKRLEVSIDSQL